MGDERILLKSRRDASFNKDLSIEPNFNRIRGSFSLDSTFNLFSVGILTAFPGKNCNIGPQKVFHENKLQS